MAEQEFIIYSSDEENKLSLGNEDCGNKPVISLNYGGEGARGEYGRFQTVIQNPDMEYLRVMQKHDTDFDWQTGGEVTLGGIPLLAGDKVYLAGQTTAAENGIYTVATGAWTFDQVVDSNLYIDLGATATDEEDGDLTREIIIYKPGLDFNEIGVHTISYYVINDCCGRMGRTYRKIKVIKDGASIMPTGSFKITHYEISSSFDPDLAR